LLNLRTTFFQGMELAPGSYHLEVSADGFETKREWVELEAGEDKHISIGLTEFNLPLPLKPTIMTKIEALPEKTFTNRIGMKFVLIRPELSRWGVL